MLTKFKKIFLLVMFAAFTLVLAGCGNSGKIKKALKNFELEAEVTEDFTLPTADADLEGSVTEWASNNPEVIKVDGTYAEVLRPSVNDAEVILTAKVTLEDATESREFVVKVKKLEAPTTITIDPVTKGGVFVADDFEEGAYLLKVGETAKLNIKAPEEEMSTEVRWSSGSAKTISVDEEGNIKGLAVGHATITAMSTSAGADGKNATAKIKIFVVEDVNPRQVLLNNKKQIIAEMPRFVYEDVVFPQPETKGVEVAYSTATGDEIFDGEYTYVEGVDRLETIHVVISYRGETNDFDVNICVVADPENNEFLALDYAKEQLDKIFEAYDGRGKETIKGNIELPEAFTAAEAKFDVAISYDQETECQPRPIKFGTVDEKYNLIYTKPNDNADVKIEVYIATANNDDVIRYNVVAQGYTQAEIMEYIKDGTLPKADAEGKYVTTGAHLILPAQDMTEKFNKLTIEWKSSNEKVLTNNGKFADPFLAATENVTMTATVKYGLGETPEWTEEVAFEYTVNPAANKAQSVSLELSRFFEDPAFLEKVAYFPFGDLTRNEDKTLVNIIPLPNKISEVTTEKMTEYQDVEIVWGSSEEGLIDANHKLLKQYLRYHEVGLTYTITVDGESATNEIRINVGIAEKKNTQYIGGNFQYSQSASGIHQGDALSQLSKFDAPVGSPKGGALKWGFGETWYGSFGGYTFFVDGVDEETGRPMRYQYYTTLNTLMYMEEDFELNLETKEAKINRHDGMHKYETNWGLFFINNTGKDVKIPLSTLSAQPFLGLEGEEAPKWGADPKGFGRDSAFSFDGWRNGFVLDTEGKVRIGSGAGHLQDKYDADGDGKLTDEDYWVTMKPGELGMTFKTQINNPALTGRFCEVGTDLHMKYFEPFNLSVDGNTEGYGQAH